MFSCKFKKQGSPLWQAILVTWTSLELNKHLTNNEHGEQTTNFSLGFDHINDNKIKTFFE
jgi:hypothetical protein